MLSHTRIRLSHLYLCGFFVCLAILAACTLYTSTDWLKERATYDKSIIEAYAAYSDTVTEALRRWIESPTVHSKISPPCRSFLTEGDLVMGKNWMPKMCTMVHLNVNYLKACFKRMKSKNTRTRIVFVGDSRTRYIFQTILQISSKAHIDFNKQKFKYDYSYLDEENNIFYEFIWKTYMDEWLAETFQAWAEEVKNETLLPNFIVIGNGAWFISKYGETDLEESRQSLIKMLPIIDAVGQHVDILWMTQDPDNRGSNDTDVMDHRFRPYNEMLSNILNNHNVHVWNAKRVFELQKGTFDYVDMQHSGERSLLQASEMLLNFVCNRHVSGNPKICCSKSHVTNKQS